MMRTKLLLGLTLTLAAAACSSPDAITSAEDPDPTESTEQASPNDDTASNTSTTTATSTTTTTSAPTTTTQEPPPTSAAPDMKGVIEASFVGTPLTVIEGSDPTSGAVSVYFNNGESGRMVAIFHGPGAVNVDGLCFGTAMVVGGVTNINPTNGPASDGACEGFTTNTGALRVCTSGVLLYQTDIANDAAAVAAGYAQAMVDGSITGIRGTSNLRAGTPEIDMTKTAYDIDPMFTSDGSTMIECSAAIPR